MNIKYFSLDKNLLFDWFEKLIVKAILKLETNKIDGEKIAYYKLEFFRQYF